MAIRNYIAGLITAGMCALPIVAAPIAAAAQREPNVTEISPDLTMTQTNGSTSMHAHPQMHTSPMAHYPWFMFG
jgi:hypothetical protein